MRIVNIRKQILNKHLSEHNEKSEVYTESRTIHSYFTVNFIGERIFKTNF